MTKSLGEKEINVVARLSYEKTRILTLAQFDKFFNYPKTSRNNIIYRLKKKGILTPIKKGLYIFSPLETGNAGRNINEYLIASALFPKKNYYIGYSTMYNYYGFTEQIFQTMYILNTTIQCEKNINSLVYKILKVSKDRIYGLDKIKVGNDEALISDKEKTLVDMIYFSDPVGGLKQALEILKDQVINKKINIRKLIRYASLFPVVKIRKRIGFVLDQCGEEIKTSSPLFKSIKKTALVTLYDTGSRKGRIDKKWGIIENATS